MNDDERHALRVEGLDPDDPAVIAAIDLGPMGGDDLTQYEAAVALQVHARGAALHV